MKGKSGQNQGLYRAIMDTISKHGRDLTTSGNMFLGMINITKVSKLGENKVQHLKIWWDNSGQKIVFCLR